MECVVFFVECLVMTTQITPLPPPIQVAWVGKGEKVRGLCEEKVRGGVDERRVKGRNIVGKEVGV